MAHDSDQQGDPLDPRVYFAAERTLLAWVRTGLALMGFGFVVARFGLFLRELAAVRKSVTSGRPFGSEAWAKGMGQLLGLPLVPKRRGRPAKQQVPPTPEGVDVKK